MTHGHFDFFQNNCHKQRQGTWHKFVSLLNSIKPLLFTEYSRQGNNTCFTFKKTNQLIKYILHMCSPSSNVYEQLSSGATDVILSWDYQFLYCVHVNRTKIL